MGYSALLISFPILLCIVPRKSSSSGSTRKRQSSLKQPLTVPNLLPRVTRSVSREKANSAALSSPPFLPTHSRHPPLPSSTTTTTTTHPQPTKSFTPSRNMKPLDKVAAKKSPPVGLASKEKQKRYGGTSVTHIKTLNDQYMYIL